MMFRLLGLIEFILIFGVLYLIANVIRYFFFSNAMGDAKGFFALSDIWIKNSKKGEKK